MKAEAEDKGEENSEDGNVNELVTLAASKSAGHNRETPQSQPIQKKHSFIVPCQTKLLVYFVVFSAIPMKNWISILRTDIQAFLAQTEIVQ